MVQHDTSWIFKSPRERNFSRRKPDGNFDVAHDDTYILPPTLIFCNWHFFRGNLREKTNEEIYIYIKRRKRKDEKRKG